MNFFNKIGIEAEKVNESEARITVRGVAFRNGKVLMITSNRGEYTFPGGGVEPGESEKEALTREVLEETGYTCQSVGDFIGKVYFRKPDKYDLSQMYELVSKYYLIEVGDEIVEQNLTKTEAAYEIEPIWIDIDEAIKENKYFRSTLDEEDYWILQELYVLEELRKIS